MFVALLPLLAKLLRSRVAQIAVVIGVLAWGSWRVVTYVHEQQQARTLAELALAEQTRVNDSTVARLTVDRVPKDSVAGLETAVHKLHGQLVAALAIRVPKRDTLFIDTLETTLSADSTRTAKFADSTAFGIVVDGKVTAPPCCAPLSAEVHVTRAAFRPEIGFVKIGKRYAALVVWGSDSVKIESPYFAPPKPLALKAGAFIEGDKAFGGETAVRLGLTLHALGLSVDGYGEQTIGSDPEAHLGVRVRKDVHF